MSKTECLVHESGMTDTFNYHCFYVCLIVTTDCSVSIVCSTYDLLVYHSTVDVIRSALNRINEIM